MASVNNSKPARGPAPLVAGRTYRPAGGDYRRLMPAALLSVVFNAALIGGLTLAPSPSSAGRVLDTIATGSDSNVVEPAPAADDELPPESHDPLLTTDVNPDSTDKSRDINYNDERIADVSVPGRENPNDPIGIENGDKNNAPMNLPPPPGWGRGQGGALKLDDAQGNSDAIGQAGGMGGLRGAPLPGSFYGRSGATRLKMLEEGGGTNESESAVARGLKWILKQQSQDGRWALDGAFKDRGQHNDIAGTAFGLLPLLGAGYTHKAAKNVKGANPFEKPVEKGLMFLVRKQDKHSGNFGGGTMYAHALATIAICEAYGLSQDAALRGPAQKAVTYLVTSQHSGGGWRYQPGQAGDLSVTGWVVMALKSAQMAGLDVPEMTLHKAIYFIDSVNNQSSGGYSYGTFPDQKLSKEEEANAKHVSPTRTAIGLLCRQYLQNWGPKNLQMIKAVDGILKQNQPQTSHKDIYYYYYATQVMHHLWGEGWKVWNAKMRDMLLKTQDVSSAATNGSWSPVDDYWGSRGGRLMETSLALLTLEVYYRHLPLYYREAGERRTASK